MPHRSLLSGMFHTASPAGPDSSAAAERAENTAQQLEVRLERALLTLQAMWALLEERLGVTDAELVGKIEELDLMDGQLDGKLRKPPLQCPDCDRIIPRKFSRCLYCGIEIQPDPFG